MRIRHGPYVQVRDGRRPWGRRLNAIDGLVPKDLFKHIVAAIERLLGAYLQYLCLGGVHVMRRRRLSNRNSELRRMSAGTKLGVQLMRAGLSGAIALSLLFVGAWTATLLFPGPTERFVELFTNAAPGSTEALKEGILVAALAGFLGTASGLLAYRAIAALDRL